MIRSAIIREAYSWLGTRWHHQGRIKKTSHFHGGVDCAGLIVEVGNALQLFSPRLVYQNYDRLPQDLLKTCGYYLIKKSVTTMLPGDILVFRIAKAPQHLAIYTNKGSIVHAYVQTKRVVESSFNEEWRNRLVAVYSYPGMNNDH